MTASRTRAAAVGVLAAASLEAVARLIAAPLGAPSPVVAVGDAVVRLSPPALTSLAIRLFGTYDKAVLLGVIVAAVVALAAVAGLVALRRPLAGTAIAAVLVAAGVAAAVTAPTGRALDALPVLVGAAVALPMIGLGVLRLAGRRTPTGLQDDAPQASTASPPSRRTFLAVVGTVAASIAAAAVAGQALARSARDAVASRAGLRLPTPATPAPAAPAGAEVSPTTPFRTPNADFYRIDTALTVPQLPAEDWTLRIHGLVDRELRLDWTDLVSRPSLERWITLVCVSNEVGGELVGNAVWQGVSLADLLAEAGPLGDADMVLSTSVDGYTASTPVEAVTGDAGADALLAYGMNGEPLPLEHGFPVRMVVPGLYGYVSATKWVVDLEVTRFADATAFWTPRGYAERAPVKVASRIDVPRPFEELAAGRVAVAGVAWAPGIGIGTVEVRVDGGPWQEARLAPVPTVTTWQQWTWEWDATPGMHTVEVRAADGDGTDQEGDRAPIKPDGATGWHSVVVRVA